MSKAKKKTSAETKAKISETLKGRRSPMAGKLHSPETKAKISEARRAYLENKKQQSYQSK